MQIYILQQISKNDNNSLSPSMSEQRQYRYEEQDLAEQLYDINHGDRIDENEVLEIIREEFGQMFHDGYDFRYMKYDKTDEEHRRKKLKYVSYKLKLKYACVNQNCPKFNKSKKKSNEWTTNFGLIQFGFLIQALDESYLNTLDYLVYLQKIVIYTVKFGKQKCIQCSRWTSGLISRQEAVLRTRLFCCYIRDQLENWEHQKLSTGGQKKHRRSDPHLQDLCEPCWLGKCKYLAIKQRKVRRRR